MKKTQTSKRRRVPDDAQPEYRFDYSKSKPNRFAERASRSRAVVVLDPDIAEVFTTPESVNEVLRALITTMPRGQKRKASGKEERFTLIHARRLPSTNCTRSARALRLRGRPFNRADTRTEAAARAEVRGLPRAGNL